MQECGAWAINQTLLRLFFSFLRIPPNISPDLAVLLGAPRSHCGPVGGEEKYRNTVGRFLTAGEHTIDTDDGRRANDSAVSG